VENLEKRLGSISGGKVLDVATGRGEFINVLMNVLMKYREFIGIDNSDRSVAFASDAFATEPVRIEKMDATAMTFPNDTFDTVAISNSLHHMDRLEMVISEMMRVLRPGGHFIVREMICDDDQTPAQLTHVLLHHWWGKVDTCLGITHKPTFTRGELETMMRTLPLSTMETFEENDEDLIGPEHIDQLVQMMDPYVERIRGHQCFEALRQEGEGLKCRLREVGFASSQSVVFIGIK